jgi:hypothetical protein
LSLIQYVVNAEGMANGHGRIIQEIDLENVVGMALYNESFQIAHWQIVAHSEAGKRVQRVKDLKRIFEIVTGHSSGRRDWGVRKREDSY